jgi:hypothetical protein
MFKKENVELYLKSINLKAEDDNKRFCALRLFRTPISYELAAEVSEKIADRLFRKSGSSYQPVQEMGRTELFIATQLLSMEYRRSPDYPGHEVLIENVSIGNVWAQKLIPGNPNFSLLFDARFEIMDKTVISDLTTLLHETFYFTFKAMQPGLFSELGEWDGVLCRMCDAPNPEWGVEGSKPKLAYCEKHKDQKIEDERLIRIADHARAQVAAEGDPPEETPKPGDPLLAGADINKKASQRQRGKRVN